MQQAAVDHFGNNSPYLAADYTEARHVADDTAVAPQRHSLMNASLGHELPEAAYHLSQLRLPLQPVVRYISPTLV